ncbi:MAG: long-chain fatty acid--CoA ligase [Chloroflexi bacterium]|nr:long-chain fatty acid--CoA ligase [Chloroflexota bacterium]
MHVADFLTHRALLTPNRVALVDLHTGQRHSYADLNARANRAANFLRGLGVAKGDRVALLVHNSVVYLDLLFGLMKIGAIFAPLNWRLNARELIYILQDLEPKVMLVGPKFEQTLDEMRSQLAVRRFVGVEGTRLEGAIEYESALAQASRSEPPRPTLTGDDPCCILYTSGTTGLPKGALIPHRQVLWNAINTVVSWGLTEGDISPIFTPLFHTGGLFAFLTPIFYAGGRVVLARGFDAEVSLRVIEEEGCTVILGVPTLFKMWREASYYRKADFGRVHFFISGGAPCPADLMQAWREEKGVVFRQGYGLTEVGPNCFSMTDEESTRKAGSVGKPVFHSRMRLVDPHALADVRTSETGELLISGPHVCAGYWRKPEATREALLPNPDPAWPWPWFRTGDMARRDEEGFYTIVGRFKDMIISGGENIYAAEVEAVLRQHPAVAECALIGKPDETWGEVGLMVVVLKPGADAHADELKDFCAQRLARYKVPKEIIFTDALPYSPYGKVMKSDLKRRYVK